MSGAAPSFAEDRRNLMVLASALALVLREEIDRLEQDARRLDQRLPRFAVDVRNLRARCVEVLAAAEAVASR